MTASGQLAPELGGVLTQGLDDVGKLKIRAEQGDMPSQVKLADSYLFNFKSADALKWYLTAVAQGSLEAQHRAGELLLFGRVGIPKEQTVTASPLEGLKLTYRAAIGSHKGAWRNMAKALQTGSGCSTNLVEASAWLVVLADSGSIMGKVEMNALALKLSSAEIAQAKSQADGMKAGKWPPLPTLRVAANFTLGSVTLSPTKKLAVINNRTVAEGEKVKIRGSGQAVEFTCKIIEAGSVTILVTGENTPRVLKIEPK